MTAVLGISVSHYGSACIVADGVVQAAVLEERLSRKKFDAGFPLKSIQKVFEISGISPSEIDEVAVGTMCETFDSNLAQDHEYRLATRLLSVASLFTPMSILESSWLRSLYRGFWSQYTTRLFLSRYKDFFSNDLGISPGRIRFYEHHPSHMATAYYASPWRDDVLLFTSDGNGDGYCGYVGLGSGDSWQVTEKISSIHSLGGLYSRATRFIGMKPWQDEYKVMGLAPWGARKKQAEEVYRKLSKMWGVDGLRYRNHSGYACNALLSHMNRVLNNPRFDYVAYGVQRVLEDILAAWVDNNMKHHRKKKIALSGGIFYNIKANKVIVDTAKPDDIFVFPTAGDESVSIGAAYLAYAAHQRKKGKSVDIQPISDVYWGENIDGAIEKAVRDIDSDFFTVSKPQNIEEAAAELLAKNTIVGLCQGKMEYCPRALGNRSLLANPSDIRNVERLNDTIKRRDFWMPFALTVLKENEKEYIINPFNVPGHYMIMGFDTVPENRDRIIAGIHQADKTVRPQILEKSYNPRYHSIISKFKEKSGIGAVLNTSLNLHGEPMVNLPAEALTLMRNSDLSYLVLGDYLIARKSTRTS